MRISDRGLEFVAGHEGIRLQPYNDPSNFCTVGIGHLIARRRCTKADYDKWGTLTQQQAMDLFRKDIERFESAVNSNVKVPLTQPQFDSLVSFSFNVGIGDPTPGSKFPGFRGSTLLRKLNAGDYQGAADEFPHWNKSDGKVHAGLTRRRAEERAMFLSQPVEIREPMIRPSGPWSLEVEHGMRYLKAAGVPHRVTSVFRGRGGSSRHDQQGTDGPSLAVDFAGTAPGWDTPELLAIFEAFLPVEHLCFELIYSGADYNIKRGKRVARYAIKDHWNHVHLAFDLGVFLPLPNDQRGDLEAMRLITVRHKPDEEPKGVYLEVARSWVRHVADPQEWEELRADPAVEAGKDKLIEVPAERFARLTQLGPDYGQWPPVKEA